MLIVTGTTDLQISVEKDAAPLAAAARDAELVVIEGMNHVLKHVSGTRQQQIAFYGDPGLPIAAELVDAIVSFIR